jgi:hypothetical protein
MTTVATDLIGGIEIPATEVPSWRRSEIVAGAVGGE